MATQVIRGVIQQLGRTFRLTGQQLDKVGVSLEGRYAYTERCKANRMHDVVFSLDKCCSESIDTGPIA